MTQSFRVGSGGRVDRSRPIEFSFNGKAYQGFHGDTLASALLANGVRAVTRSFKFHRPRGIVSAGVEESSGILAVDYGCGLLPVVRSTQMPLIEDLKAESQNCYPTPNFDFLRILDYTRGFWPAGFYNKVFKWPSWHAYEWMIRHMAGLGRLPETQSPARFCHMNSHCDVLVVGSGLAGLTAALQAGRAGKEVIIVEQDTELGGSLLHDPSDVDGQNPANWLSQTISNLQELENVQIMLLSTVAGYYDDNFLTIHDRCAAYRKEDPIEVFWKVRASEVVLATGAIEQPLLFGNNDLPGIMYAGAMRHYANRFGVQCGKRVVGVVNNDLGWHSVMALPDAGIEVAAILDTRAQVKESLEARAEKSGLAIHLGAVPIRARGSQSVKSLEYRDSQGRSASVQCDAIAMSGGLNPTVHLYSQAGGRLR